MTREEIIDIIFAVLALISIILMLDTTDSYRWISDIIIVIFAIYILYLFIKAENKWEFIKTHPFEIIALIPLNSVFQGAMIIRVVRLLLALKVFKNHFPKLTGILLTNNLYKSLSFTGTIMILAAIPITYFEEDVHNFGEGIWWAIVTTTTVGYGDIVPVTVPGRIVATILMLVGIGSIGLITGSVASFFANPNKDDEKEFMKKRIDNIETLTNDEYEMLLTMIKKKRKLNEVKE